MEASELHFVIAAILMVCFWDWLISFLPVEDTTFVLLTQLPEVVIFLGILATQGNSSSSRYNIRGIGYGLDALLLGFLAWTAISTLLARSAAATYFPPDPVVSLLNIKALIRYFGVFYIVARVDWRSVDYLKIRSVILTAVAVQAAIGLLQILFGQIALEFFSPRGVVNTFGMDREVFLNRERGSTEIFGTFRNTISYAYLMMIGVVTVLVSGVRLGPVGPRTIAAILIGLIFFSGSRIAFFVSLAIYISYFLNVKLAQLSIAKVLTFSISGAIAILSLYLYVLSLDLRFERGAMGFIFTQAYIDAAMNQRLGIMTTVLPQLFYDPKILFGFGADKSYIANYAISTIYFSNYALAASLQKVLEDVYWVALLLYFGIPGITLFLFFLSRLYGQLSNLARAKCGWLSEVAEIARLLLLTSIPLNFVNQAYEVQTFSLGMWTLSAIALRGARGQLPRDEREIGAARLGAGRFQAGYSQRTRLRPSGQGRAAV